MNRIHLLVWAAVLAGAALPVLATGPRSDCLGLFPLTADGTPPAHVLSVDDQGVTFRTHTGVERHSWWDLDLFTADYIGRASGQFVMLDVCTAQTNDYTLTRAIVSRTLADGTTRYYLPGRFRSAKRTTTEAPCWPLVTQAPRLVDINTIIVISNELLLAYRDFDADGALEKIILSGPMAGAGREGTDDSGRAGNQRWHASLEVNDQVYMFDLLSPTLPAPPEPSTRHPNHMVWGGAEYALDEFRFDPTDPSLRTNDIKVLTQVTSAEDASEPGAGRDPVP